MSAVNIIKTIIYFVVLPTLSGYGVMRRRDDFGVRERIDDAVLSGYMLMWCVIELAAIPVCWYKGRFTIVVAITLAVTVVTAVVGVIRIVKGRRRGGEAAEDTKQTATEKQPIAVTAADTEQVAAEKQTVAVTAADTEQQATDKSPAETTGKTTRQPLTARIRTALATISPAQRIIAAIYIGVLAYIIYMTITLMNIDTDDSRFLVLAVDTWRTDTILQTDPTSGGEMPVQYADFKKDIISQWPVFLAYGGRLIKLIPTIYAHVIYPVIAIILYAMIVHLIACELVERELRNTVSLIAMTVTLFGGYTLYSGEVFMLERVWQGKATVAGIGIAYLLLMYIRIYKQPDSYINYLKLLTASIACCLMSGNGVVMSAVMTGCFAVMYLLIPHGVTLRKRLIMFALMLCTCIPAGVLYMLRDILTIDRFLG